MICLKNEIILPEAVVFDDSGKINQQVDGFYFNSGWKR